RARRAIAPPPGAYGAHAPGSETLRERAHALAAAAAYRRRIPTSPARAANVAAILAARARLEFAGDAARPHLGRAAMGRGAWPGARRAQNVSVRRRASSDRSLCTRASRRRPRARSVPLRIGRARPRIDR